MAGIFLVKAADVRVMVIEGIYMLQNEEGVVI